MKGKYKIMAASLLMFLPLISYAEDTATIKEKMDQRREAIKVQAQNKKEEIKNQVQERRTALQNKVEERLYKFIDTIAKRYRVAVERLGGIADRIESRISKFESAGSDQSQARELLAAAREKISLAQTSADKIKDWKMEMSSASTTATTTPSADIKNKFPELKDLIAQGKEDIKAAHAALVETIRNLKPGLNKATTTDQIEN